MVSDHFIRDPHVKIPFNVDTQSNEKHYTYLDTTGRTVLVIEKKNAVKEHNQYFQVHYKYSKLSMLQEPFLVAGALFAFFLAVIFYVRFEISIKKVLLSLGIDVVLIELIDQPTSCRPEERCCRDCFQPSY